MPEFVRAFFCRPVDEVGVVRHPVVVVVSETGGRDDGDAAWRSREAEDEVKSVDVEVAGGDEQQGAVDIVSAREGVLQAVQDLLSIVLVAVPVVPVDEKRVFDERGFFPRIIAIILTTGSSIPPGACGSQRILMPIT